MSSNMSPRSSVTSQDHLRGASPDSLLGRSPDSFCGSFWPGYESGYESGFGEESGWSTSDPVPCDMISLKRAVMAAPEHEVSNVILGANMKLREQGFTSLIQLCGKRRQWNRALQVFNALLSYPNLKINTYSYTALISALSQGGQQQMALFYFDQQLEASKTDPRCLPNQHTYSSAISACERAGLPFKALEVYNDMKNNKIDADNVTYSAILTTCQKHGLWNEAENFIDIMESNAMPPSIGQYHNQLKWYGNTRECSKALDLFLTMQQAGQQPTVVTCQITLEVFQMSGRAELALNLLDEMLEKEYQIDMKCFNIVLRTLYNCEDWKNSREVYDKLINLGFQPDNSTAKYILGVHQSDAEEISDARMHDEWLSNVQQTFDQLGLCMGVDEEYEEDDFFDSEFFPFEQNQYNSFFGFEQQQYQQQQQFQQPFYGYDQQFHYMPPPPNGFLGYPLPRSNSLPLPHPQPQPPLQQTASLDTLNNNQQ